MRSGTCGRSISKFNATELVRVELQVSSSQYIRTQRSLAGGKLRHQAWRGTGRCTPWQGCMLESVFPYKLEHGPPAAKESTT